MAKRKYIPAGVLFWMLSATGPSRVWFGETHLAIAKAAGYLKKSGGMINFRILGEIHDKRCQ